MPFLPMRGSGRLDIVNADFVGRAIADLHVKPNPAHDCYHLSSGTGSKTAREIGQAMLSRFPGRRPPRFVPMAEKPFAAVVDRMAGLPKSQLALIGSLLKVFLPYITLDTVFDNERVCRELGDSPTPFTEYCGGLYEWSKSVGFEYPYEAFPRELSELRETGAGAWA
jgi:hypothetical protein